MRVAAACSRCKAIFDEDNTTAMVSCFLLLVKYEDSHVSCVFVPRLFLVIDRGSHAYTCSLGTNNLGYASVLLCVFSLMNGVVHANDKRIALTVFDSIVLLSNVWACVP